MLDQPPDFLRKPVLPHAEQERLALCAQAGDRAAMDALIGSGYRLIRNMAYGWSNRFPGMADDLVSMGMWGYSVGVMKWKPGHGANVPSYCMIWAKAYIQKHLISNASIVKFGTTQKA